MKKNYTSRISEVYNLNPTFFVLIKSRRLEMATGNKKLINFV